MKKVKTWQFGLAKGFGATFLHSLLRLVKSHSKAEHFPEKGVINMI